MGLKTIMMVSMLLAGGAQAADEVVRNVENGAGKGGWESLVEAERAFAKQAADEGVRAAFLSQLADDAVLFAPQPQAGRAVWEARPASGNRLEWAPAAAELALAGDLGYTFGPWRYTPEGADQPAAHGHYLTVWQKNAEGIWKVRIDHGIEHGPAPFPEQTRRVGAITLDGSNAPAYPPGLTELRQADLLPAGQVEARQLADDAVLLRQGFLPLSARKGVVLPGNGTTELTGGALISKAGDLAVTWGGSRQGPTWLRIWRRPTSSDPPGLGWRLAVDLSRPAASAP